MAKERMPQQLKACFDKCAKVLQKTSANIHAFHCVLVELQRHQRNKIRRRDIILSQTYIGHVDLRTSIDTQWPMRLEWP